MRSITSTIIGLLSLPAAAFAQHTERLGISGYYIPVKYGDTSSSLKMTELSYTTPLYKSAKSVLTGGMEFKAAGFKGFPEGSISLYALSLQSVYVRKVSERLSLALFGQVGIYSDWKDISTEDMRTTIGMQYRIKYSERFKAGLGVAYGNQFYGHQLSPYVTIDYRVSRHWYLYGQVPTHVKLEYIFSDKDFAGFGIRGINNSYRLSKTEYESHFIQFTQWSTKLYWEHYFAKRWSFTLSAGYALIQKFKMYQDNGETFNYWNILTIPVGKKSPEPLHEIKQSSMFFQAGISYGIFKR